jgi:hypothetical protein
MDDNASRFPTDCLCFRAGGGRMRVRQFQPIADSQTDSHQGDLWQLGRRPNLGSLGRLVLPPSESHAITTDEPRHRRQAERQSLRQCLIGGHMVDERDLAGTPRPGWGVTEALSGDYASTQIWLLLLRREGLHCVDEKLHRLQQLQFVDVSVSLHIIQKRASIEGALFGEFSVIGHVQLLVWGSLTPAFAIRS